LPLDRHGPKTITFRFLIQLPTLKKVVEESGKGTFPAVKNGLLRLFPAFKKRMRPTLKIVVRDAPPDPPREDRLQIVMRR
jgi:hypothetical protein